MRYFIVLFISFFLFTGVSAEVSDQKKGSDEIRMLFLKGSLKEANNLIDEYRVVNWSSKDRTKFYRSLINISDELYKSGDVDRALSVRELIKEKCPNIWEVYSNAINSRSKLSVTFLKDSIKQLKSINSDFFPLYFLLRGLHKTFYYSFLLVLFFWSLFLLTKYFNLACHDLILEREGDYEKKKLLFTALIFLFPLIYFGGWAFYILPIIGFLYVYIDRREVQLTRILIFVLMLFLMIEVFFTMVDKELLSPKLQAYLSLYKGEIAKNEKNNKDNEYFVRKALLIFNNSKKNKKELGEVRDLLSGVSPNYKSYVKSTLLGDLYRIEGNHKEAIVNYNSAMQFEKERDKVGKRLLSVIASLPTQEDKDSMYETYVAVYPELAKLVNELGDLEDLQPAKKQIWGYILSLDKDSFSFGSFLKYYFKDFFLEPLTWMLILFFCYIFLLKSFYINYGKSVACSRCGTAVNGKREGNLLCDECNQLFIIKDMAFVEVQKSKKTELNKRSYYSYLRQLAISIFVPGFALNHRGWHKSYALGSWVIFSMILSNYYIGSTFLKFFGVEPLFLSFFTIVAIVLYLLFNLISLIGQEHGF